MNNLSPIFEQLKRENITLRVDGVNLIIHPKERASQSLVMKIRESKPALIMFYNNKISMLNSIIYEVGKQLGETEMGCEEMFEDTLEHHSIEVAIALP